MSEEIAETAESLIDGEGREGVDSLLGRKFESHAEVQEFINNMEVQSRQKYSICHSRTIKSARSRGMKRCLKPELIYYSITYACIHGGGKYKSKGKGIRQSSTFKMDCPFKIRFSASEDGNHLQIVECSPNHVGHGLSEKVYEHLPQVRRLNKGDVVTGVQKFLEAGFNTKLLKNKQQNITFNWKENSEDFLKAARFLEENYDATACLLQDEMENFKALYFSTEDMRRSMLAFPEIVFLDRTYKLSNYGFTLILMIVEDANGVSEIVGVCLICDEDYETFKWFLTRFKEDNEEASNSIKCFMTEKDLIHRDVISDVFVDVPVYIISNRLESLSQKIRAAVVPSNSLHLFLKCFMNWLSAYNEEIKRKVAKIILKKAITKYEENSCEKKYMDLLTPYAYSYVIRQCALSKKVTIIVEDRGVFKVKNKDETITVDTLTCDCSDFTSMLLPCRHILCVRSRQNLPLYCEEICNKRWLKENYLRNCRFKFNEIEDDPLSCTLANVNKHISRNPAEKRKQANRITSSLVNLACTSPDSLFDYRIDCLKEIEILWRQGYEVQINKIDPDEDQIMDCETVAGEVNDDETVDCEINFETVDCKMNNENQANNEIGINEDPIMDEVNCVDDKTGEINHDQNEVPQSISNITEPHKTVKKVRPRGSESDNAWSKVAVVSPKKKRKITIPTIFASKQVEIKKMQILKEIVLEYDLIPRCLEGKHKITSADMKAVEQLSHCLLNPAMDLQLVEDFFEPDAFTSIKRNIESLEGSKNSWCCAACNDELGELRSICCDSCLKWHHVRCAGISEVPVKKTWFCSTCCCC